MLTSGHAPEQVWVHENEPVNLVVTRLSQWNPSYPLAQLQVPLSQYPPLLQTTLSHKSISQVLPAKGLTQTHLPSMQPPPLRQFRVLQGLHDEIPNRSKRASGKYMRKGYFCRMYNIFREDNPYHISWDQVVVIIYCASTAPISYLNGLLVFETGRGWS